MTTSQLILSLFVVLVFVGVPRLRALRISMALLFSREVVVREYYSSNQISEHRLSSWAIIFLAVLFALPQGWSSYPRCLFTPHHDIRITSASGSVDVAVICFGCQMMKYVVAPNSDSSISHVGRLFDRLLRWYFRALGIAVQ